MKCLWVIAACVALIAAEDAMNPDFCVGREDGRYAYGCRRDYIVCNNGLKTFETCKDNMYFNHYSDSCQNPWEFDLCAFEPYAIDVHRTKVVFKGFSKSPPCPIPPEENWWKRHSFFSQDICGNTYYECVADKEGPADSTAMRYHTCPPGLTFDVEYGYCKKWKDNRYCPTKVEHRIINGVDTIIKPANWDEIFPWPVMRKPKTKSFRRTGYGTAPAAGPYPNNGYNTLPYGAQPINHQFAPQQPNFNQQSVTPGSPIRAPKLPFNAVQRPPVAHRPPVVPVPAPVQTTQVVNRRQPYSTEFYPGVRPTYVRPQTTDPIVQEPAQIVTPQPQPHRPRPVAPQPQKPVGVQPTAPVVDFDCSTRADGAYAAPGCVDYFFKCAKGQAFKYVCPTGNFFSSALVKCVSPRQVTACQGQEIIPSTAAPPTTTDAPVEHDVPQITTNPDFCVENNFTEGYHNDGCSSLFYECIGVIAKPMRCQPGKFYDPSDNSCDEEKNVFVCGGTLKLFDIEPETIEKTTETNTTIKIETIPQVQPQPPTIIEQPPQTTTNSNSTTTTTTTYTINSIYSETYCSDKNLPDGEHGFGCSDFFYSCHAGNTYKMPCPAKLVYSVQANACDEPEFTPACGGTLRVIQNTTTIVNETNSETIQFDSSGAIISQMGMNVHNTPALKTDFQCGARVDGFYVVQNCLPTFVQCAGGHAYVQACPAGLLFDIKTESCNYKDKCGQEVAPVTTEAHGNLGQLTGQKKNTQPGTSHIASSSAVIITNTTTTTTTGQRITTYDCKVDGFFQLGRCAPNYVQCENKIATRFSCPDGLVFNNNVCEHPDICAKSSTTTSSTSSSSTSTSTVTSTSRQTSQNSNVGTTTNQADSTVQQLQRPEDSKVTITETTITQINNVCVNRPDGYIAEGCASVFYSCLGGAATKVECPNGLFYDITTKACYPREYVVACGGQALSKTTTTVTNITTTTTSKIEVCDKPDGSYADDCTSNYYVCTNGNKIRYQCPANLIFSTASGACEYKTTVERCNGTPATQTQSEQTGSKTVITTTRTIKNGIPSSRALNNRKIENVCADRIDGIYGRACSRFFLICRKNVTTDFICPMNTAFNVKNGKCEDKALVPGCQEESAPTLTGVEPQYRRRF